MLAEQIKIHENFGSAHLDAPRNVLVYLPPGYGLERDAPLPGFVYARRAKSDESRRRFRRRRWGVDETAQELILTNQIEPLIIVGIYNAGEKRIDEYTPVKSAGGKMRGRGGQSRRLRANDYRRIKTVYRPRIFNQTGARIYRHRRFVVSAVWFRFISVSSVPMFSAAGGHIAFGLVGEQSNYPRNRRSSASACRLRIWLDIGKKRRLAHQASGSRAERNSARQRLEKRLGFAYSNFPKRVTKNRRGRRVSARF